MNDERRTDQFDELVVDDWIHIEQMDTRSWWMRVGGYHLWIDIPAEGEPVVTHDGKSLDDYGLRKDH